jgi:hypothetical protein
VFRIVFLQKLKKKFFSFSLQRKPNNKTNMIAIMLLMSVVAVVMGHDGMLSLEFSGKRNALQQGDCANSNPCTSVLSFYLSLLLVSSFIFFNHLTKIRIFAFLQNFFFLLFCFRRIAMICFFCAVRTRRAATRRRVKDAARRPTRKKKRLPTPFPVSVLLIAHNTYTYTHTHAHASAVGCSSFTQMLLPRRGALLPQRQVPVLRLPRRQLLVLWLHAQRRPVRGLKLQPTALFFSPF